MTGKTLNLVAIDCGNSSIRVTLGRFDGKRIETELIHSVEQKEVFFNGFHHWDFLFIYQQLKNALAKAYAGCGHIDSAAISTWGIDFGLFNRENMLLFNPLSYRNSLGKEALDGLPHEKQRFNFLNTGIKCDKINTLYQILGFRERFPETFGAATRLLLVPDILNYLFTGEFYAESTESSTSQLYDTQKKTYSDAILSAYTIPKSIFAPLKEHGTERGWLKPEIAKELGINLFPFITIPAHDTAAAVTAIAPEKENEGMLFISSGTWSLVGTELSSPLINEDVYHSDFTNEAGILGTTTFLKNSAGLFIARRLYDECFEEGKVSWDFVTEKAAAAPPSEKIFDPNDEELFNPPDMKEALIRKTGQSPADDFALFRAIYDSLAASYRDAVFEIERLRDTCYDTIYVLGGGSRNALLNRLTVNATGKRIIAGPDEATSIGNLGAQLLYEKKAQNLSEIRRIIKNSVRISVYDRHGRFYPGL
jgi:rhamnulokinase